MDFQIGSLVTYALEDKHVFGQVVEIPSADVVNVQVPSDNNMIYAVQRVSLQLITPDFVNSLTAPTDGFACSLSANRYEIEFTHFKIRAIMDGAEQLLFEVGGDQEVSPAQPQDLQDDSQRFIRYHFGPGFLDLRTVGTTLDFKVGPYPLHNFRMIERHYFRDVLIRSYDFEMPFVIPQTTNTWEVIYSMPELNEEWKAAVVSAPWETKSDSFYFVNGELVMHNRAEYNYSEA